MGVLVLGGELIKKPPVTRMHNMTTKKQPLPQLAPLSANRTGVRPAPDLLGIKFERVILIFASIFSHSQIPNNLKLDVLMKRGGFLGYPIIMGAI